LEIGARDDTELFGKADQIGFGDGKGDRRGIAYKRKRCRISGADKNRYHHLSDTINLKKRDGDSGKRPM
jgi:hypothetical protein